MDISVLDNSTVWVAISFVIFVLLIIKPALKMMSSSLENKIVEISKTLKDAKKLEDEAKTLFKEHQIKQKKNIELIRKLKKDATIDSEKLKENLENEFKLALKRKEKNFEQISNQLEIKIKEDLKNEIVNKTVLYTQERIKKNISNKNNKKLIEDSIDKVSSSNFNR